MCIKNRQKKNNILLVKAYWACSAGASALSAKNSPRILYKPRASVFVSTISELELPEIITFTPLYLKS
jgi:hypothetical protein